MATDDVTQQIIDITDGSKQQLLTIKAKLDEQITHLQIQPLTAHSTNDLKAEATVRAEAMESIYHDFRNHIDRVVERTKVHIQTVKGGTT